MGVGRLTGWAGAGGGGVRCCGWPGVACTQQRGRGAAPGVAARPALLHMYACARAATLRAACRCTPLRGAAPGTA